MTCFHPRYSVLQRCNGDKYSVKYNVLRETDEVSRNSLIYSNNFTSHYELPDGEMIDVESRVVPLPCGRCLGCRLDYSRQWAQRCVCEAKYHSPDTCFFVTLTYDDKHLPFSSAGSPTVLEKNEFSKYLKRLRSSLMRKGWYHTIISDDCTEIPVTFRFFMCAEYGDRSSRPHYHILFFGIDLQDVVFDPKSQTFRSEFLEKWWSDSDGEPLGFVSLGQITYQSAAYVARYALKKLIRPSDFGDRVREWTNMSLRPAIGRQYFDDHKDDIYFTDKLYQKLGDKVLPQKPPRYYDKLLDVTDHQKCEEIKAARAKFGEQATILRVIQSSKGLYELLRDEEEAKADQITRLKRQYESGD